MFALIQLFRKKNYITHDQEPKALRRTLTQNARATFNSFVECLEAFPQMNSTRLLTLDYPRGLEVVYARNEIHVFEDF